ncbi:hypothetical protein D9M68_600990 [compost metagenome]
MPLRTSLQGHRATSSVGPTGAFWSAGAIHSARGTPSAGYSDTTLMSSPMAVRRPGGRAASRPLAVRAVPATPCSTNCSVASVSLTLARSTYIDRRLSVAARMSRLHTSRMSSGCGRMPMKLAITRPLAVQSAARRASVAPSREKSCVSWPCKKLAASGPSARITPRWGRVLTPLRTTVVIAELSWPCLFLRGGRDSPSQRWGRSFPRVCVHRLAGPFSSSVFSSDSCAASSSRSSCSWPWPFWRSAAPVSGGCTSRSSCRRPASTCPWSPAPRRAASPRPWPTRVPTCSRSCCTGGSASRGKTARCAPAVTNWNAASRPSCCSTSWCAARKPRAAWCWSKAGTSARCAPRSPRPNSSSPKARA